MVQKEKKYITWEGLNQHAKNVGKKIKECDTGVIGGYNGSFPLTAATKGNIYLLPATKKYYVCIKNYNGSQLTAPNANFEELSVYTNRSKLDNLGSLLIKIRNTFPENIDCQNKEVVIIMFEAYLPQHTIDLVKILKNVKVGSIIHFFSRSGTNLKINISNFYWQGFPNNNNDSPNYWIAKPLFTRYYSISFYCDLVTNYEFYLHSYQGYEIVENT